MPRPFEKGHFTPKNSVSAVSWPLLAAKAQSKQPIPIELF